MVYIGLTHSMLSLLLLSFRVKGPIGEYANLPILNKEDLKSLLQKSEKSLIIFARPTDKMDFTNFAIEQFKSKVTFARAHPEDGEEYNCTYFPCMIPFHKDKVMDIPSPPYKPAQFLNWIPYILDPLNKKVDSPEELRQIFEGHTASLLSKKPISVESSLPKYVLSKEVISYFSLDMDDGVYVYRPIDRQLIHYESDSQALDTPLIDPLLVNISTKPFFAGYMIDTENDVTAEKFIEILKHLSTKYGDRVHFSPLIPAHAETFLRSGKLDIIDAPYFFVFETEDITNGRWLIYNSTDDLIDVDKVDEFLDSVVNKNAPKTIISLPDPKEGPEVVFRQIVASNFKELVFEDTKDVLVAFTAPWCGHCKKVKPVLQVAAEILNATDFRFYWFDGSKNDHPSIVPEYEGYPTLLFWPAGSKDKKPIEYDGDRSLSSIMDFITLNTEHDKTIPEYDAEEAQKRIDELLRPPMPEEDVIITQEADVDNVKEEIKVEHAEDEN